MRNKMYYIQSLALIKQLCLKLILNNTEKFLKQCRGQLMNLKITSERKKKHKNKDIMI
jgi:hypothetical protein